MPRLTSPLSVRPTLPVSAEAAAGASEDAMRLNAEAMVADGAALTEEEVTRTMGYPPDPFQV